MNSQIKYIIAILLLPLFDEVSAQSKKDLIETLTQRLDSVANALIKERTENISMIQKQNQVILSLEKGIKELKDINNADAETINHIKLDLKNIKNKYQELAVLNDSLRIENDSMAKVIHLFEDSVLHYRKKIVAGKTNNNIDIAEIEYDGKPELEYFVSGKLMVLDYQNMNDPNDDYIRVKINNRTEILRMNNDVSTKNYREYKNNDFKVVFTNIIYGKCAGEGRQLLSGAMKVVSGDYNVEFLFTGADLKYSDKKCQETGND